MPGPSAASGDRLETGNVDRGPNDQASADSAPRHNIRDDGAPPDGNSVGTRPTDTNGPPDETVGDPPGDSAEPLAARERLVFLHTGDVSLDRSYVPALQEQGPAALWDGVRDAFAEADVVAANLECPVGEGGVAQPKQFVFRCDPSALPAMRDAGVDVLTLANNHSGDYGLDLMLASVDEVERAGILPVGVGADEADAHRPQLLDVAGWRIAVLGFGGVVPEPDWISYGDEPGQATGYDAERMAESVAAAAEIADLVAVSVHWGAEGSLEPRPEDRVKARAMIAAGADVIFGHHAHRLQPLERVDGASVFWNLGNFVWPRFSEDGARTALAQWTVEPDGTTQACLLPAEINQDGVPEMTGAEPVCA